jgi:hypothetical protein
VAQGFVIRGTPCNHGPALADLLARDERSARDRRAIQCGLRQGSARRRLTARHPQAPPPWPRPTGRARFATCIQNLFPGRGPTQQAGDRGGGKLVLMALAIGAGSGGQRGAAGGG